jgi:hypothetical protein
VKGKVGYGNGKTRQYEREKKGKQQKKKGKRKGSWKENK